MGKVNAAIQKFNAGIVSKLGLARTDVKHIQFSAEEQTNWISRTLGSMMLRPGRLYIDGTLSNNYARHIPFIFSNSDTAIIEMTSGNMRVRVDEEVITRTSVRSAVTNGTFSGNLTGWTQSDQAGCTSAYATGDYMSLVGTNFNHAARYQQISVITADANKEHGIHIVIARGYVDVLIGTSAGDSTYLLQKSLGAGVYSFAVTPTGSFYIQLQASTKYASLVKSVAVEAPGAMAIATPYGTSDLQNLRWDQSADVIFIACSGLQQYKIERFASRSWALVKYFADDGPFQLENIDQSIQFTPSAITGDITLTCSSAFFTASMVGMLLRIQSQGQEVDVTLTGANQFSSPIEVTGIGAQRNVSLIITGTWSATITIQQSVGAPGAWVNYLTYTTNQNTTFNDGDNNSIIFYRIGINSGNYTSGTATASLVFSGGSIEGICRITAYTSATSVTASVLKDFGGVQASFNWWQGVWSAQTGFPTSVALFEGRLWFGGQDNICGSISDAFASFDDGVVGDSGPINRSIGSGPVDTINWLFPGLRLVLGGEGGEHAARSSAIDTPLTPTDFILRTPSTYGSSNVQAQKIDWNAVFVKKDGVRVCLLTIENAYFAYDYKANDLTIFVPEIGVPGIVQLAVQRIPDTRIHAVRSDGKVAVNVWDDTEEVKGWQIVDPGENAWVEDAFVLPPLPISTIDPNGVYDDADGFSTLVPEDTVYYVVRRTINGQTVRYLERWAWEYECQGGTLSKQEDCHTVVHNVVPSTSISVPQLAGEDVIVWGDGIYQGTFTANGSGNITLTTAITDGVAGLSYTSRYKSCKLAYASQMGTALGQKKIMDHVGLLLVNAHPRSVQFGKDFDSLRDLPSTVKGRRVTENEIFSELDTPMLPTTGTWDTDSRLCLQGQAPFPATILGVVIGVKTSEQ